MNTMDEARQYVAEQKYTMMEHQIPPKSLRIIEALIDAWANEKHLSNTQHEALVAGYEKMNRYKEALNEIANGMSSLSREAMEQVAKDVLLGRVI